MKEGYSQIIQQIQALEEHLLEHQPDLLWFTPLIRRQNVDYYKERTSSSKQGKKLGTQIRLLLQSIWMMMSSSQKVLRHKADYFLLEHGIKRAEWLNNSYFNRFPDALTHFLQARGSVALGEIIEHPSQWKKQRWQAAINLFPAILTVNVMLRIQKLRGQIPPLQADLAQLHQIIQRENWKLIYFDAPAILTDAMRILLFKRYFQRLLRRLEPRLVFSFCYYSKEAFGLTLAAKSLQIPMVEVQHGTQGSAHLMYASYPGTALGKHELLPDLFWVWSKSEKDYVDAWVSLPLGPSVICGGNPWLAYYKTLSLGEAKQRPTAQKRVLITLQQPHNYYDSFLEEMLLDASLEIEWLLRVHPHYTELEDHLTKVFAAHSNIQVAGVNQQNLFEQFLEVDLNITSFSTTCLEGLEFGVPSIIIHPTGKSIFDNYIQQGYFRYAENAVECLRLIQEHNFTRPPVELLQGDEERVQGAIDQLEQNYVPPLKSN